MFLIDSVVQWKHLLEELALVLAIMEKARSTEPYWIHCWRPRWLEKCSIYFNNCFILSKNILNMHHAHTFAWKQHLMVNMDLLD
jgi:hypothetical protein